MTNPIKPTIKSELPTIFFLIIIILSSFYFYSVFPDRVPIHWNLAGEADGFGSRFFAAFFFPVVVLLIYLLMLLAPILDPKREKYVNFKKTYHIVKFAMIIFMGFIYFIASSAALNSEVRVGEFIPLLVGFLFVFIGNYLGKIRPNWFMGIRTPWTLSSETVWNKTHRLGGKIFMLSGFIIMTTTIFNNPTTKTILFISAIAIILIGTVGSSAYFYFKEKGNE